MDFFLQLSNPIFLFMFYSLTRVSSIIISSYIAMPFRRLSSGKGGLVVF